MDRALFDDLRKNFGEAKLEKFPCGKRSLWLLRDSERDEQRLEYISLIGRNKIDEIVNKMVEDTKLRNIMLVDLQFILRSIRREKDGGNSKFYCLIDKPDERNGIYEIISKSYCGVAVPTTSERLVESTSTQDRDFIDALTTKFAEEISQIKAGTWRRAKCIDIKEEVIEQIRKLIRIGKFTKQNIIESENAVLVRDPWGDEKIRAFFSAWQLKVFFEHFVAKLVEKSIKGPVLTNAQICVYPSKGKSEPKTNGFLEQDVLAYDEKKDHIILIECKNGMVPEKEVSKFIGRAKMIEETYGITIDKKIIIGTKYRDWFFYSLPEEVGIVGIQIFDNKDYRRSPCYAEFINFLKS